MLSSWGVEFEPINVAGNPGAQADLRRMGVPAVPATVAHGRAVHGWNPESLAELVGVEYQGVPPMAPGELADSLDGILAEAQRIIETASPTALESMSPGRPRTLRNLAYHLFRVAAAFVDSLEQGEHVEAWLFEEAPEEIQSGAGLAEYGRRVRGRLERWFQQAEPAIFPSEIPTYYGPQTVHALLERTAWHVAQHHRQVHDLMERAGALAPSSLDSSLYAGLPIPTELW